MGRELDRARAPHKMSPMVDIAVQRKEMLAHDLYFKMLSSEFHDSVIIQ